MYGADSTISDDYWKKAYLEEHTKINQETMKPKIQPQDNLALYPQVSYFIFRLLSVAIEGGMPESRARNHYDEILECFANVDGTNFLHFREELIGILKDPDKSFDFPDVDMN